MKISFALVKTSILAAFAFLAVAPASSHAALLFSTLGQTVGGTAGINYTNEWWGSDFQTGASATTATSTSVRLSNEDSVVHSYRARIYTDAAGQPGSIVGSFSNIVIPVGLGWGSYTGTSAGISLAANTKYWEVLHVNEDLFEGPSGWAATPSQSADVGSVFTPVSGTGVLFSGDGGASWDELFVGNQGMFSLEFTAVPEVSSAAFIVALACMAMAMRRRGRPAVLSAMRT